MLDREKDRIYTTTVRGVVIGALTREQQMDAVECRICSAPRGSACTGEEMKGGASHPQRRKEAMKLYGIVPPQAVLSGNKIDAWYKKFRAWTKDPDAEPAEAPRKARRKTSRPRSMAGVTVRYVCPLCGGSHSRADHPAKPTLRELVERRRKERAA